MRPAIRWGLILAACLCSWTLLLHVTGVYTTRLQYASAADNLAIIFPLFALTGAMLERRRRQADALTLRDGFVTGFVTMCISWLATAAFMLLYHHVIHPEWLQRLIAFERQRLLSSGATDAQIASMIAQLSARAGVGYELRTSLVGTLLFGVVASLLIALILRRRKRQAVGSSRHLLHLSLASLVARLDPRRFAQVHRAHVVNLERAFKRDVRGNLEAEFNDGTRVPVSRARAQELRSLGR